VDVVVVAGGAPAQLGVRAQLPCRPRGLRLRPALLANLVIRLVARFVTRAITGLAIRLVTRPVTRRRPKF
jgi:hypothetical protein